jgi:hypothetical protein
MRLRCLYCESDIDVPAETTADCFVVADPVRKTFTPGLASLTKAPAEKRKALVIYRNESDAMAAGFAPREANAGRMRMG